MEITARCPYTTSVPRTRSKPARSPTPATKADHRWQIFRLRGTPAAFVGIAYGPDEKTAIKRAIEEYKIPPEHQWRLIAQRRD
jgi:hypothetical protein